MSRARAGVNKNIKRVLPVMLSNVAAGFAVLLLPLGLISCQARNSNELNCLKISKQSNSYNPDCRSNLDSAITSLKNGKYVDVEKTELTKNEACSVKDVFDIGFSKHGLSLKHCAYNDSAKLFYIKFILHDFRPNGEKARFLMDEMVVGVILTKYDKIHAVNIGTNI
jgi:hypothetical protein